MDWPNVFQGLSAVGGGATFLGILSYPLIRRRLRSEARKNEADAVQVLTNTAVAMLAPANEQIDKLTAQLREANTKMARMKHELEELQLKLRAATISAQVAKARTAELETEIQQLRNQISVMTKELDAFRGE